MLCPNDGKTKLFEGSNHLNWCPHCGYEVFATERCIRDMMKEDFEWHLPLEEFLKKNDGGESYNWLLSKAWTRINKRPKIAPNTLKEQ